MTYREHFKRELNLSSFLARHLAKELETPYLNLLKKIKTTAPQSELSRKRRLANLKNVFKIKFETKVKEKNILLVDDILTTGSTAKEAASLLKMKGAANVYVAALARAGHYENS